MPTENHLSAVVGGTVDVDFVYRGRVVYMSDDFKVLMMLSSNISFTPYGIAQGNARKPAGTPYNLSNKAGDSGDEIMVYGPGSTGRAECGGTVTAGMMVTVDGTARIVDRAPYLAATSVAVWDIGMALEDGAAGDMVRIRVMPQLRNPA